MQRDGGCVMKNNDAFLVAMGVRISAERKRLGLSQEILAEMIDVSPQTISTAERGEKAMRPESIYKLSKIFECSTDYLLGGEKTEIDKSNFGNKINSLSSREFKMLEQILTAIIENRE
jgi:transcriptional regulator with XRE-family HTH domain